MIGALSTLVVAIVFLGIGAWMIRAAWVRRNWPTVQGAVIGHKIDRESQGVGDEESITFIPVVEYCYEVSEQNYARSGPGLGRTGYGSRHRAEKVVARYPAGAGVDVHYNAAKPAEAFLESSNTLAWIFSGVGIAILIVAILLAVAGI